MIVASLSEVRMRAKKAKNREMGADALAAALADWRAAERPIERLSAPVRHRILDAITAGARVDERPRVSRPLFFPLRRLAFAGAVPVLLLAAALGYLARPVVAPDSPVDSAATRLEVQRVGDEVVFRIANGSTTHRIYKSSALRNLDDVAPVVVEGGEFRDRVEPGAGIVYYKIQ